MMRKLLARKTGLLLVVLLASSCDNERCKYREGVDTITISANPTSISAVSGASAITAICTAQDNLPMADGTIVTFVADLGGFDQGGQAATMGGIARITFLGGADGTAHVYARSGRTVSPTIEIAIGTKAVGLIRVTANPGSLNGSGGDVKITALVLSKDSLPLEKIPIEITADEGTFTSGGGSQDTGSDGKVRDTLRVGPNDTGDTREITITASYGTTSGTATVQQQK